MSGVADFRPGVWSVDRRVRTAAILVLVGPFTHIALGRWGAYIGLPGVNLFLADLATFVGVTILLGLEMVRQNRSEGIGVTRGSGRVSAWALAVIGLVIFAIAQVAVADGPITLVIRDILPFLYLCLVPFYTLAVLVLGSSVLLKYLKRACFLHSIWAFPAAIELLPTVVAPPAIFGQPLFGLRNDFDGLIFGLGLALVFAVPSRRRVVDVWLLISSGVGLVVQPSRAGLIGAVVLLLIYAFCVRRRPSQFEFGVAALAIATTLLAGILIFSLSSNSGPESGALARLGVGSSASQSTEAQSGQDTARARDLAWDSLFKYTVDGDRLVFGWGPGSEMVRDSNALVYLSGDPSVRAPHSWPVGLLCRFGVFGVIVWCAGVLASVTRRSELVLTYDVRTGRRIAGIGWGLGLGLLLASTIGVVMESPFGAVPFSFSLALIAIARSGRRLPV